MRKEHNIPLRRVLALILAAVLTTGVLTAAVCLLLIRPSGDTGELNALAKELQGLIDQKFVGEQDKQGSIDGALAGYVDGMGDRWSYYMSAEEYEEHLEKQKVSGVGIGVNVVYDESAKNLCVLQVFEDSPAEGAGLQPYDRITAVNGVTVAESGYEQAVDSVRGEIGTDVALTVLRAETEREEEITITRQEYAHKYLNYHMMSDGTTGYVQIERFLQETGEYFIDAMKALEAQGAEQYVFDLRNNPGGQLSSLVECLDYLLPEGRIITLEDADGNVTSEFNSDADCVDAPMSVIINEDSYSAAEFFAAALQEYDQAEIVGEQTCGKGYSQQTFALSNGAAVALSTHCYYTPNHVSLIGKGVMPDVACELSAEEIEHFYALTDEEDSQIAAAKKALE
ncbi:MAG: S41 family peptidase [Butyricicoccaceae bacterium]